MFVTEEGFCCETQFVDFIFRFGFTFELIPEETGVDNIKLRETDVAQGVYRIIMYIMEYIFFQLIMKHSFINR